MSDAFESGMSLRTYSPTERSSMHMFRRMYALDIWRVLSAYSTDPPEIFLAEQVVARVKEKSPESLVGRLAVQAEIGGFIGEGMARRIMPPPTHRIPPPLHAHLSPRN